MDKFTNRIKKFLEEPQTETEAETVEETEQDDMSCEEAVELLRGQLSDYDQLRYLSVGVYHSRLAELEHMEDHLDTLEFKLSSRIERHEFAEIAELVEEAEMFHDHVETYREALDEMHDQLEAAGWL